MDLTFTKRNVFGRKVFLLRSEGQTPVVCYSDGSEAESYSVSTKSLKKILSTEQVVITADGDLSGKQVMLQDIAVDPLSGTPIHADFLFVDTKHEVEHEVPVYIIGEAPSVKKQDGQMIVTLDKVTIRALPQDIPGHVDADVSSLEHIGAHLTAADLPLPASVILVTNPQEIVVSIVEQSQEEEKETTDETYMDTIEVAGKKEKKQEVSEDSDSS